MPEQPPHARPAPAGPAAWTIWRRRIGDAILAGPCKDIAHRLVRNRRRDPGRGGGARRSRRCAKGWRSRAYAARAAPRRTVVAQTHHGFTAFAHGPGCRQKAVSAAAVADLGRLYREMLAFAAIQPERFVGPEVGAAAADYLGRFAPAVVHAGQLRRTTADFRMFWVDPAAGDSAPIALARRPPPAGRARLLYFSCARLGTLAAEHLRELEAGTDPAQLAPAARSREAAFRGLLHKLARVLGRAADAPPPATAPQLPRCRMVHRPRRPGPAVRRPLPTARTPTPGPQSEWTVLNESPSGLRCWCTSTGEHRRHPQTGEVVAIRGTAATNPGTSASCAACSANAPARLESGPADRLPPTPAPGPCSVAFRHVPAPQTHRSPRCGCPRRRGAAPATKPSWCPAGTAASQRFVMAAERRAGSARHAGPGGAGSICSTASVELLEFLDDPYPLTSASAAGVPRLAPPLRQAWRRSARRSASPLQRQVEPHQEDRDRGEGAVDQAVGREFHHINAEQALQQQQADPRHGAADGGVGETHRPVRHGKVDQREHPDQDQARASAGTARCAPSDGSSTQPSEVLTTIGRCRPGWRPAAPARAPAPRAWLTMRWTAGGADFATRQSDVERMVDGERHAQTPAATSSTLPAMVRWDWPSARTAERSWQRPTPAFSGSRFLQQELLQSPRPTRADTGSCETTARARASSGTSDRSVVKDEAGGQIWLQRSSTEAPQDFQQDRESPVQRN
ncbi:MAG: hypothetical protein MZV65_48300 [Chromatiales bacterium]|nr:hypothetical protein [Chromatiales bacterium]